VSALAHAPYLIRDHGPPHARRTAQAVASLIGQVPGADSDVVAVFALMHDAKRFDDPTVGLSWDACRLASEVVIPSNFLSTSAAKARRPS
jgi:hypothetical protein